LNHSANIENSLKIMGAPNYPHTADFKQFAPRKASCCDQLFKSLNETGLRAYRTRPNNHSGLYSLGIAQAASGRHRINVVNRHLLRSRSLCWKRLLKKREVEAVL
jgi:hypothetical protein